MMESVGFDWSMFFSILFLKNDLFDGIKLTLALAFGVWIISSILGFLLAEAKFSIPKEGRYLIDFVLWVLKSIPILVLIYYFYLLIPPDAYDNKFQIFFTMVWAMSFWATANLADIFYRYRQYRAVQIKDKKTKVSIWIVLPALVRFLATIVTITPLVVLIGGYDFFAIIHLQLEITYQINELFLAAILVYLILTGIITLFAKLLEKILRVPESLI